MAVRNENMAYLGAWLDQAECKWLFKQFANLLSVRLSILQSVFGHAKLEENSSGFTMTTQSILLGIKNFSNLSYALCVKRVRRFGELERHHNWTLHGQKVMLRLLCLDLTQ